MLEKERWEPTLCVCMSWLCTIHMGDSMRKGAVCFVCDSVDLCVECVSDNVCVCVF